MKTIKELEAIRKDVGLNEWDCGQAEALRDVLKLIDEWQKHEWISIVQVDRLKSKIKGK